MGISLMNKVSRINQVEADVLDNEYKEMLLTSLVRAFEYFDPRTVQKFKEEISLIIDFIFFRFTLAMDLSTPGQTWQNLKLILNQRNKRLYLLLEIVLPYVYAKASRLSSGAADVLQRALQLYRVVDLFNFIRFLATGSFPRVSHRIMNVDYEYIDAKRRRYLDFELLNRTVVWNVFSDFMITVVPILQKSRLFAAFKRLFHFTTFLGSLSGGEDESMTTICGICRGTDLTMPQSIPGCNHIFCYYCLSAHEERALARRCPICQQDYQPLSVK
eukprot:TRINITY_DN1859_c0_g1_i2.p1 TRINITY_DN1859_c0_g1~~TRINITY_DN1859_c0_g1_i2.p1  ORF type:complete len:306 (-),score=32.90 TRINITY_DN1859_c0_g1_i2:4-822(-)